MRLRRIKFFLLACLVPALVLAQSYFGNFGQTSTKTSPAPKASSGTSLPAPIPAIATPDQFRASVNQPSDQGRVASQYKELLAKQPPLVTQTGTMTNPPKPPPAPSAPQTPTPPVTTTPVVPPVPPSQVAPQGPTASQVQIAPAPALPGGPQPTQAPPATTSDNSVITPPVQSPQVYTGFQAPSQNNNAKPAGMNQNSNDQGGWKIKY